MHIAVCDDNVADRKQLERLLKRESDKHALSHEPFYIDGYGSSDTVMRSPMLYDVFFIDMTVSPQNGFDIAVSLNEAGISVPIVLCVSKINYREFDLPSNVMCIDKPVKVCDLCSALEYAYRQIENRAPRIELRGEKETYYVKESDIMYVVNSGGQYIRVSLSDGREVELMDTLDNFYEGIKQYPCILPVSCRALINADYIKKVGFTKVITKDGNVFAMQYRFRNYVNSFFREHECPEPEV